MDINNIVTNVMELEATLQKQISTPNNQKLNPSRLLTNIFLLVGIGLLVLSGQLIEGTLAQYLIGSLVEGFLALLAVGFVKINHLPVKATFRLYWPGWEPLFLSLVAAPGLWMMGVALNILTSLILGYTTPTPPQMFPTNVWESVGFAFAAVIAAPICEELMFRGYVQRTYERGKPLIGILVGGFIFTLYHMQFQGLFALLPVALALGFVAWRTESVLPGMVLHAAYNSIATIILITSTFLPYQVSTVILGLLILMGVVGLAITAIAFGFLWHYSHPKALPKPAKVSGYLHWVWIVPLFLLALIYIYGSVNEVIVGRFPELLATDALDFEPPPAWQEEQLWEYDIQDIMGTTLGSASCTLDPVDNAYQLSCQGNHQASSLMDQIPWDIPWLTEKINIAASSWEQEVMWSADSLQIVELHGYQQISDRKVNLGIDENRQTLIVTDPDEVKIELEIPADTLIVGEWPWRLAGLPLELFYSGSIPLVTLNEKGEAAIVEAFISVRSAEPTWTSLGSFITWKVTVTYTDGAGKEITEAAWYDIVPPHHLIRYDDGHVNYVIRSRINQDM